MLKKELIREANKGFSFESTPIRDHEIILPAGTYTWVRFNCKSQKSLFF